MRPKEKNLPIVWGMLHLALWPIKGEPTTPPSSNSGEAPRGRRVHPSAGPADHFHPFGGLGYAVAWPDEGPLLVFP